MPQLTRKVEVKQFYLPSTMGLPDEEQAWVKMDISPMKGEDLVIGEEMSSKIEASAQILSERITEWNFTDETNNKIDISLESCKLLDLQDFIYLQKQIKGKMMDLTTAQKKTLS